MDAFLQDLRYAARRIAASPAFSALIILTLAVGIGANTAIFSVVNSLLLRPLPYENPDQLVEINHLYPRLDLEASVSAGGFADYRNNTRSFSHVSAQMGWAPNLVGGGEPERLQGSQVSAQWFAMYGVTPAIGRTFLEEEDAPGRNRVVVLSHGFWQRRFGEDPGILGRTLSLDGEPHEVVGVMPRGFEPFYGRRTEIFRPIALTPEQLAAGRTNEYLTVTARLHSQVTLAQAQGEMRQFAERLKQETPDQYPTDWSLLVTPLNERARGDIRPALLVLLGSVGLVLLIACANVANLLLARAAGRRREVAVRTALGAQRFRVVRQLLTESMLLALVGGGLGLLLAYWGVAALIALAADFPRVDLVTVDGTVLAFTALIAVATGLVFGLAPAVQTSRVDVQDTLREGGRGAAADRAGHALRRIFVVTEFTLALTLLAGAGLLLRSFGRVMAINPGFEPENVLVFDVALPVSKYPDEELRRQFFNRAIAAVQAVPGVVSVGGTQVMPFGGSWSTGSFTVEHYQPAEGEPNPWGDIRLVTTDFHETLRIPLLRGRYFEPADGTSGRGVVIVDQEMVRRYWPDQDPIGKRILRGGNAYEVIGVVGHAAHEGLDADPRVQLYAAYDEFAIPFLSFAVRTQGEPLALLNSVRQAIRSVDPDQPIARPTTMETLIAESVGERRLAMVLLGMFAAIALLLAATGIYGVISHGVTQRTQELGVRIAMGARARDVLMLVMKQGLVLAAGGVAIGLGGAFALTRLIRSQLYQVEPTDPVTFGAVALILVVVGTFATLLPALRALRVDPVRALRQE